MPWASGAEFHSTFLGRCQGGFRPLADLFGFVLGNCGQNVNRELVGVGVIAGDEINA